MILVSARGGRGVTTLRGQRKVGSMPTKEALVRSARGCGARLDSLRRRLGLTWRGMLALGGASVAIGALLIVFAGVSEDVTQRNGLASHDRSNLQLFTTHRTAGLVHAARIVTGFGSVAVLAPLAVMAGVVLWYLRARVAVAAAPLASLGLAGILTAVGKQVVGRGRPPIGLRLVGEADASFPSGHAADSAAVYLALGLVIAIVVLRHPLARFLTVGLAGTLVAAIGGSRLVLGVHWPTDVLAGWALGTGVALAVVVSVTLLTRVVPRGPLPPRGRLRRAGVRVSQLLAASRASRPPGGELRAAS